ncbi:hypothetical protein H5410_002209, partial [Solanum commersonii]
AENRSKKLHNPFVMVKVNIKKVKKDSQSSSKVQSIKPQKIGVAPGISRVLYLRKNAIVQSAITDKNCEFWIMPNH